MTTIKNNINPKNKLCDEADLLVVCWGDDSTGEGLQLVFKIQQPIFVPLTLVSVLQYLPTYPTYGAIALIERTFF